MSKIHVLQLAPLSTGGITALVLSVRENLKNENITFDYLTFRDRHEFNEDRALSCGGTKYTVDLEKYKNSIIRGFVKFFGVYKIVRRNKINVFHINTSTTYEVMIALSAKLGGVRRIILHSHNSRSSSGQKLRCFSGLFKRMMPSVATDFLACSQLAAEYLFPPSILRENKYAIIKNGIDVKRFAFDMETRKELRKEYNLENSFVVGHIGRFCPQKNHLFLIDIFAEVFKVESSARLFLIGEGETQKDARDKVSSLGLSSVVIFCGASSIIPKLLQLMDVFLLPSLFEGLPVSGVEAQAAGLPMVVSDSITKELKLVGNVEFVSLQSSPKEWAEEVLRFRNRTDRKDTTNQLTKAGYNINETVKKLTEVYLSDEK